MKLTRITAFFLAILISLPLCLTAFAEEESKPEIPDNPGITSNNAVVAYSIDDDQILYSNRLDERVAPTVITKLVTCMVVSDILKERGLKSSDVMVTVDQSALDNLPNFIDARVPTMGLKVGNEYTAKDLLSSTLVACAHDSASVLAYYFGDKYLGGIGEFIKRMNQKVESLGLTNTNFVNPVGLDSPNQYTTPREAALIAAAFYQYNELVNLSNVESFLFNGKSTVRNKNYLKCNYYVNGFLNKNAIGFIAGQLDKNGNYCLVTASQKEGRTYIFVVMCASGMVVTRDEEDKVVYSFAEGNAYDDINKLINWTRNSFKLLPVATTETIVGELRVNFGSSSDHVMIVPETDVEKLVLDVEGGTLETKLVYDSNKVYKKEFNGKEYDTIDAPVTHNQKVGTIVYSFNGKEIATVSAVTKEGIEADNVKASLNGAKDFLFGSVMKTVLYIVGGLIIFYIVISIVLATRRGVKRVKGSKKPSKKIKTVKKRDKKSDTKDFR